jgi:hypothetical protein
MYSGGLEQQHGSAQRPQRVPDVDHQSSHFNVIPIPYYTLYSFPSLFISHPLSKQARKLLEMFYNLSTTKLSNCCGASVKQHITRKCLMGWDKDLTSVHSLSPLPSCHLVLILM